MALLNKHLENIHFQDKHFIGTVTFKNEELALPDGTKMALGMDDGHWVLIYQRPAEQHMKVYKYDHHDKKIMVDQKAGQEKDLDEFMAHLSYFFENTRTEDLVTLLPPQG
ncbi:MAG: hypothetical protein KJ732_00080 [Candidatus Margulisbacteria bacterium]|nr:hypothetical protein [Candidatus Margulisiibacteriota bacterium]